MNNIFIMGSKGIPSNYGGFETFVDELVSRKRNPDIKYFVSCLSDTNSEFNYNGATCLNIKVPDIKSATAVLYDLLSLNKILEYIEEKNINKPTIYILACRIGPFMSLYKKRIKKNNVKILLNPDGHEWKRSKWPYPVRRYWKISEKLMVRNANLVICDSKGIENYIKKEYEFAKNNTTYIAYGSESVTNISYEEVDIFNKWINKNNIVKDEYFLIVGRFVPENNYELMIREFMKSKSEKKLVIITNNEGNKYFEKLKKTTKFDSDPRILFVGTVYDKKLLYLIRKNCFAYLHGHSVGGTNPSLLEALSSTKLNLLYDVEFNSEVGEKSCLYFSSKSGDLKNLIEKTEKMEQKSINLYDSNSSEIINKKFTWDFIVDEYEKIFVR